MGWKDDPVVGEWAKDPVIANPNMVRQAGTIEDVRSAAKSAAEALSRRDPGIDYKTDIQDFGFRAGFSRRGNDAEKALYLDRHVGAGNWGKDSHGAYFIKPQGLTRLGMKSDMPVALDSQKTTLYDVADVAGDAPAILGGVGAGLAATGLGAAPGVALAALGAAGGKAIDEVVLNLQGDQVKTPGEVATTLGKEAAWAAGGEAVPRLLAPVGRHLLGPGASRMTPEKKAIADSAIEQGFKIRPGSVTDKPLLARWEGMFRQIFGDVHEEQNRKAAVAGIERLTDMAGGKVSKEAAGEGVQNAIRKARVRFSEDSAKLYARVDEIAGNSPIIPTASLKEHAKQILGVMPKTKEGKIIGGKDALLRDILNTEEYISAAEAQRLRTMLREASESPDLLPDVAMHDARVLKRAIDADFKAAREGNTGLFVGDAEKGARASRALAEADKAYAEGILKFDRPAVIRIAKDAQKAGSVDADMVVDYLVKPDRVVRLRQVKSVVPEAEWAKVKAAHAEDLLSTVSRGTNDPFKTIFDGKAFRDALDKYGRQTLEEVHGKDWTKSAYDYANALMLAEKKMAMSGGIVAANIALHPMKNLPKLTWLRLVGKVMEQPGTFKYLTEGIKLGPHTKKGAEAISRFTSQVMALADDETGSATLTLTPP